MIFKQQTLNNIKFAMALLKQDLIRGYIKKRSGGNPTTLNLLVNDVCNSRCQMCLIWKNKAEKEFSAQELDHILSNDLFNRLQYVGVSGGEPTLRKDLPQLFEVLCQKKPKLKGLGIITNGIIHDVVKKRILECHDICKNHDIPFNIMISIDGLGDIHDIVRGRQGNFSSSIQLLNFFSKETKIPVSFGCTVTKDNVFHVDELLDYAIENNFYGRFRVAEFIDRLYNESQGEFIRSFDELESYHLALFFHRLEYSYESNQIHKKTYRNIRKMIGENKPRQIGCPYQSDSVVATSTGDLLYCSPKSPIIGNALTTSAKKIYSSNLDIREKIKEKDCQNCIHDYHESFTVQEYLRQYVNKLRKIKAFNLERLLKVSKKIHSTSQPLLQIEKNDHKRKILIVGWYGTETNGDKAILWSIINRLRNQGESPIQITLSSIYPFISEWTLKEMSLEDVLIVETYSKDFKDAVSKADLIILGGGPLLDSEFLDHILYAFINGKKNGSIIEIESCGIGPLKKQIYINSVKEILRLSDKTTLRDQASVDFCRDIFHVNNVSLSYDPAIDFVTHYRNNKEESRLKNTQNSGNLSCFLREWTDEYSLEKEKNFVALKQGFERNLALMICHLANAINIEVNFLPMHSFHFGGDDRSFARKVKKIIYTASEVIPDSHSIPEVHLSSRPLSPKEILDSMMNAKLNICMRFHSVLFAETLGVPYLAIDYTRGGKIYAFLNEKQKLDRLFDLEEIAKGLWRERLSSNFIRHLIDL
jgi:MoaA/NifB/PqqE/SkfB family radical SAM enzyme/polysaccharide pyruvyl transferase WcaK-like protein